jgi:tetratricopeptide (TPR) repeat protein
MMTPRPTRRRKILTRLAAAAACSLLASATAAAQSGGLTLGGELQADRGNAPSGLIVELVTLGSESIVSSTEPKPDGRFELRNLRAGEYLLCVVDRAHNILHRDSVSVNGAGLYVTVRLPPHERTHAFPGTVSLTRLRHKVPSAASKQFEKALTASEKGDTEDAIAHLEKALQIDPDYLEAHNNLGSRFIRLNRFPRAVEEFERALALDPTAPLVSSNLAIAYLAVRRYPEAELAARQSLRQEPASNCARYVLGAALDAQQRDPLEAVQVLETAAREFPNARLIAARILVREGQPTRAATQLRKYLQSGATANKPQVETWLANLSH